ncbi:hypothetical protein Pyn_31158 [Prunus yedoensis var. nudiflora]|uniref:Uncharacterized protein n=1 Tax=Prunus yedoensis var. nudiflora TaxID=2094558 RepID=A0A314XP70_PRUYE|nr:hypothetical protein Pyn_31158 [Prunus yedoensis var. nudiflora]
MMTTTTTATNLMLIVSYPRLQSVALTKTPQRATAPALFCCVKASGGGFSLRNQINYKSGNG